MSDARSRCKKREMATVASIVALACGACADDEDPAVARHQGGQGDVTSAQCSEKGPAVPATPIKRLARAYVENAVAELLSPMSQAPRARLIEELRTRLDLVPLDDDEKHYSVSDDRVTQDHVDAMVGLALTMAAKIADSSTPYASELLNVCGERLAAAALADDGCLTKVIERYGRNAFRRPLTKPELADFKAYYQSAASQGVDGLGAIMGRLIAHPNFYYRFDDEGARIDGAEGRDAVYKLNRWELLAKTTFLFWAAPPTDALYERVAATDITEDVALRGIVDDVLADPKSEQGVLAFFREWLHLDKTPNPASGGNALADKALLGLLGLDALPPTHREDMIREVLDLARYYTLETEGRLGDILTSPYSFARTEALAKVYGVPTWDGDRNHLVPLPPNERSGLLTRAAFVASSTEYTRPILKGKQVLTRVLCKPIPPPPPGVDIKPIELSPTKTTRQATEEATSGPGCTGCHQPLNALGFMSEKYDPLGRFRLKELRFEDTGARVLGALDVNTRATVHLTDGSSRDVADAIAFSAELAKSGDAHACFAQSYFEFLAGHKADVTADACAITTLRESLRGPGGSIKGMLRAAALAPSFRHRRVQ